MGVEQHLMCLQQIRPNQKCAAVRKLDMRHLQLDALASHKGPIFAPVELERLAWCKHQRHESSPICRVIRPLPFALPFPHEGRNPFIGTVIAQLHQIGVHQFRRSALFA